jgi:hypothetical protein
VHQVQTLALPATSCVVLCAFSVQWDNNICTVHFCKGAHGLNFVKQLEYCLENGCAMQGLAIISTLISMSLIHHCISYVIDWKLKYTQIWELVK